jgi:hypothetical protein
MHTPSRQRRNTALRSSRVEHVLSYATESASATLGDFGAARMVGGLTNVSLEPGFASTIDQSAYRVFPYADGRHARAVCERQDVRRLRSSRSTGRTLNGVVRLSHRRAPNRREA